MSLIGCARVSTAEGRQVLDSQLDALPGRLIPDICRGLGGPPPSTLCHYLHCRQSAQESGPVSV